MHLLNFGTRVKLADLPLTRFTYAGRGGSAEFALAGDCATATACVRRAETARGSAPVTGPGNAARLAQVQAGNTCKAADCSSTLFAPARIW